MANSKKKTNKKNTNKNTKSVAKRTDERVSRQASAAAAKKRSTWKLVMPYVLMVFSVVLAISFTTVHLFDATDGAGVLGFAIQWVFCGAFGPAAFILPAILFFLGLRWCLYNVKWSDNGRLDETSAELRDFDRRRLRTQLITGVLFVLLVSSLIAVIVDEYDSYDIVQMWEDAADNLLGGGFVGGSLGFLMIMCFEQIISIVIISVLLVVTTIFMVGITPNWIVSRIQDKNREKKQMRAEELQRELEAAAEAEAEARKHKNRVATVAAVVNDEKDDVAVPQKKTARSMSTDELMDDENEYAEPELKPLSSDGIFAVPSNDVDKVYIDVNGKVERIPDNIPSTADTASEENRDFGGDPTFDTTEFAGIQSIIDSVKAEKTPIKKEEVSVEEDIDLTQMENDELISEMAAIAPDEDEEVVEVVTPYVFPSVDMLTKNPSHEQEDYTAELQENAHKLMETLRSFKVSIKDITYSRGPTITRYELRPEAGTRVRAIANLVDDIALNLATTGVRIEAPIPNKPAVGIEVPNRTRATVYLRDLIDSPKFSEAKSKLTACLGMDVGGNPIYFDISKMPHLLIAGATEVGS